MFLLDLDSLDWQSWPKDPSYLYVDLFGDQVRISKNLKKQSPDIYAVRFEFAHEMFRRTRPVMYGLTSDDLQLLLAHLQQHRWL